MRKWTIDADTRLEQTAPEHAVGLLLAVEGSRQHLGSFLAWVPAMQTVDDFKRYIAFCRQQHEQGLEDSYVIIHNGAVVGRVGLHNIVRANRYAEIGYWLSKDAAGKGIITKCCETLLNYAFESMEWQRVAIKAAVQNVRSRAIPERLGFTKEGVLRQAELVNGEFLDLVVYSMLRDEWLERRKRAV